MESLTPKDLENQFDRPQSPAIQVDFRNQEARTIFSSSTPHSCEKNLSSGQLQEFFQDLRTDGLFHPQTSAFSPGENHGHVSRHGHAHRHEHAHGHGNERSHDHVNGPGQQHCEHPTGTKVNDRVPEHQATPGPATMADFERTMAEIAKLEAELMLEWSQMLSQYAAAEGGALPPGTDGNTSPPSVPAAGGDSGNTPHAPATGGDSGGNNPPVPATGGDSGGNNPPVPAAGGDSGGNNPPAAGSDGGNTPHQPAPPPPEGGGANSSPPADHPVTGKGGTPTDAASALAGFTMPTDLKGPVITPQFGGGKTDTQAIQDAVNKAAAAGGGVVHIPDGTYNIDAANAGIIMKSNVSLVMDKGVTLQALPTGDKSGCIIDIRNVDNVNVYGGKLVGDYGPGSPHTGECMSGIDILGTSSNIDIQGVESDKNKGDGFDISGTGDNIHLAHNVATFNKRDGLSIEGGTGVVVEYNAFMNSGTADSYDNDVPEASRLPVSGIDIENSGSQSVVGAIVRNNLLEGNGNPSIDAGTTNGWGIRLTGSNDRASQVLDNTIVGNAAGGVQMYTGSENVVSGNNFVNQPNAFKRYGGSGSGSGNTLDGAPMELAF